MSSSILVQGLFDALSPNLQVEKSLAWGPEATKEHLASLLCKPNPPALLFTASHGLGFSASTPEQPLLQGALVTQDWQIDRPATAEDVFAGQDFHLLPGANVRGMVHFAFACFGAGTPQMDEYHYGKLSLVAERPFVAKLPTQMLQSGMLGFIGHIDRAWGFSFIDQNRSPMLEGYKRAVNRILKGKPLGHALRDQYDRGVQLSASLVEDLNEMGFGKIIPPASLASRWMERNDARSYCLLGDPAAQVRIAESV
jgi:hypothetical protein